MAPALDIPSVGLSAALPPPVERLPQSWEGRDIKVHLDGCRLPLTVGPFSFTMLAVLRGLPPGKEGTR